jgi:ADP-heptose:LPS heptosyltransferase
MEKILQCELRILLSFILLNMIYEKLKLLELCIVIRYKNWSLSYSIVLKFGGKTKQKRTNAYVQIQRHIYIYIYIYDLWIKKIISWYYDSSNLQYQRCVTRVLYYT